MKYLVLVLLSFGVNAHADMIGYGDKDCKTVTEKRALLYNKEICALEISCNHFPLNNPDGGTTVKQSVYCRPDSANFCLAAEACLADKSISSAEIPMIIPKYGGDNVAPVRSTGADSTGNTCPCGPDKSKRTDGSKRAEPAKSSTDSGAATKRTESTSGRGVN